MHVGRRTLMEHLTPMSLALVAATTFFAWGDVRATLASCGDYVLVGGGMAHGHAKDSMPALPACDGPNCQRSLPLPIVPGKGLLYGPHSDSDAGSWLLCDESPRPSRFGEVIESSLLVTQRHSLPLLRPPCI